MVFASVFKVALTGLLATASSPYLSCKLGGWGSGNACDQLVNTVDSFAHSTFTAGQRFIPAWYDPPDPIGQQILQYREDARRWSETTDFVVAPTFDLAQWTTDVIVRPPGDLIVYISPSEFRARLRDLVPPPWTCDPLRPRLLDPTAFDTGMVGIELDYLFDIGDSIPLYTVLAFFALVFGIIDIALTAIHLVPAVRVAWSKMVVDRIPVVLAALEQVGRTIFGALVRCKHPLFSSLSDIPFSARCLVAHRRRHSAHGCRRNRLCTLCAPRMEHGGCRSYSGTPRCVWTGEAYHRRFTGALCTVSFLFIFSPHVSGHLLGSGP